MQLHIHVAGNVSLIPRAKQAWADFERSYSLPFAYEKPALFGVCEDTSLSTLAESQYVDGVGTIRITGECLASDKVERDLTLLHELLHLNSFSGSLKDMYASVIRFDKTFMGEVSGRLFQLKPEEQWPVANRLNSVIPAATVLAQHLFEVDAEFALTRQYPDLAPARTEYYVKLKKQGRTKCPYSGYSEESRRYCILLDRLRAELAGVLADDERVAANLNTAIQEVPGFSEPLDGDELDVLHRMLSPKWNDFDDLPRWGMPIYEAVIRRVCEKAFGSVTGQP